MAIEYTISKDGHKIHAIASEPVTSEQFIEYEVSHAINKQATPPIAELFEIKCGALTNVTKEDISEIVERRKQLGTPHARHRCAMVVPYSDAHGWDLAKLYEGMTILHSPEVVIVFGDSQLAKLWLGFDKE